MTRPKPLPFQKRDVIRLEKMGLRGLLSWDMGLGKTVATIAALYRNPSALPAIVVCPASVKHHWVAEAARFGIHASIAESRTPSKPKRNQLLVINYDILPAWTETLSGMGLQTIVLDECQSISNYAAKRTKAAVNLSRSMNYAIALSGTPLTSRPAELWPTLNLLRPDLFRSFWDYAQEFCEPKFFNNRGWSFNGAKNLPELHRRLQPVMIRRRKRDVLSDLPGRTRKIVRMPMRNSYEYLEAEQDFLKWLKKTKASRWRKAANAEQLVKTGYLLRLAARFKMRSVVRWTNRRLAGGEKLVLFAYHKKAVDILKRKIKYKSVVIDGGVTGGDRKSAIDQFRYDLETRLLIGNIKAAGTGVDGLQFACSSMAFAELWWVPGVHLQAESRLWRIGQTKPVDVNWLVARGTIEERLCSVLQTKQRVIGETLDGDNAEDELSVHDELMRTFL